MNPLFDKFPLHRVVLSFVQRDYRNDIHVLHGTPGSSGRNWLGLAGHDRMVPLEGKKVLDVDSQIKEKLNEDILWRWEELEKIAKLVEHPHTEENEEKIEEIYSENGRRYRTLRPGPMELPTWAVLVSKPDPESSLLEEYTVTETILTPKV